MQPLIYLDNSATTRPFKEVIEHMYLTYENTWGNPSSLHTMGLEAERLIKNARNSVAQVLDVNSENVYFTSGGTEANNLAVRGYLDANRRCGKHIITSSIEHPSILDVFKQLEKEGYKVDYLNVDLNGHVSIEQLKALVTDQTALISIMITNNETGAMQPFEDIVSVRNQNNRKAAIHADAIQTFGKTIILPQKSGIDMLSISSHKIHGPKGVGALYISPKIKVNPIIYGGGQESLIRSGTENVQGISGFGMACDIIRNNINSNYAKVLEIKEMFIDRLREFLEDISINSIYESSPYILNVSFENTKSEVLLHHLEQKGIYVSTGSACSSRKTKNSHVLRAIGLKPSQIDGAIRFSFSAYENDLQQIDIVMEALKEILPKIAIKRKAKV